MAKSDRTREKIITAAKKTYKNFGYKGTSMDMIAKEAGISKSLLTHYFSKKHIILTTINRQYLESITEFVKTIVEDDPLMIMLTAYKIFHYNILNDLLTRKFWYASMLRSDIGPESYNNSDVLYMPIFYKYNLPIDENELMIRKIQIMGADRELTYAYLHRLHKFSDKDFIDKSLAHKALLLGAPNFDIMNCLKKSDILLEQIDYSRFKLLD